MDERADLLGRYEERARRLSKKKKNRKPGRPASAGGGQSGCGTGKGGFGLGNNCAKEDGRPDMPKSFAQGGKSATAASLPATKEALVAKAAYLKKKAGEAKAAEKAGSISLARKEAAIRKKEKQEREAADKKAAEEAYAKKRAELLQKIRIKKANERLQVDGKDFGLPKRESPFSGRGDDTAVQRPDELATEFAKRKYKRDIDAYHSEAGKIEARYEKDIADARKESSEAESRYRTTGDQASLDKIKSANARADELKEKMDGELHDLIGKFTVAHAGGRANLDSLRADAGVYLPNAVGTSSKNATAARSEISKAWAWLSRVAAKGHQQRMLDVKLQLRRGGGGSHQAMNGKNEATIGVDESASQVRKTTIHEYGHAIESARPQTLKALEEDYKARVSEFLANNNGAKLQGITGAESYDAVYKAGERVGSFNLEAPSYLGYARRYSDASFKQTVIDSYANHPDSFRLNKGTEVFSTGIEGLYKEPASFRKRARHGHDIAILILAGLL